MSAVKHDLCRHLEACAAGSVRVLPEEPLSRHTTFRIGGPARYLCDIFDEPAVAETLRLLRAEQIAVFALGGGSNLLAPDEGFDGAAVRLGGPLGGVRVEGTRVRAGAGARMRDLAVTAREAGLCGLEFAATIPGTLGGALAGNAGYGGAEMAGLVETVKLLGREGGVRVEVAGEIEWSYRSSSLRGAGVVLEATLALARGDRAGIARRMRRLAAERRASQPLSVPSAGCVFRNPPGDAAGRLIDAAGLRGAREGGAEVSEVHANFIVNRGGARAADVRRLISRIVGRVEARFGVRLELELQVMAGDP